MMGVDPELLAEMEAFLKPIERRVDDLISEVLAEAETEENDFKRDFKIAGLAACFLRAERQLKALTHDWSKVAKTTQAGFKHASKMRWKRPKL